MLSGSMCFHRTSPHELGQGGGGDPVAESVLADGIDKAVDDVDGGGGALGGIEAEFAQTLVHVEPVPGIAADEDASEQGRAVVSDPVEKDAVYDGGGGGGGDRGGGRRSVCGGGRRSVCGRRICEIRVGGRRNAMMEVQRLANTSSSDAP